MKHISVTAQAQLGTCRESDHSAFYTKVLILKRSSGGGDGGYLPCLKYRRTQWFSSFIPTKASDFEIGIFVLLRCFFLRIQLLASFARFCRVILKNQIRTNAVKHWNSVIKVAAKFLFFWTFIASRSNWKSLSRSGAVSVEVRAWNVNMNLLRRDIVVAVAPVEDRSLQIRSNLFCNGFWFLDSILLSQARRSMLG